MGNYNRQVRRQNHEKREEEKKRTACLNRYVLRCCYWLY